MVVVTQRSDPAELTSAEKLALEEYKALRAESLALATTITTTTWAAVLAFIGTCGAYATAQRQVEPALLIIALLLQSIASSVIFLQMLWKYARIGIYIRTRIERAIAATRLTEPMFWEQWIAS